MNTSDGKGISWNLKVWVKNWAFLGIGYVPDLALICRTCKAVPTLLTSNYVLFKSDYIQHNIMR